MSWSDPSEQALTTAERVVAGLFVVGMAIGAVSALARGWSPVSDEALIELAVRDVPAHLPLTGVYSRFGWSHPGPALFYLLAVPYRLLGGMSAGLLVGVLALQGAATLSAWRLARRLDRVTGMVVFVGLLLVLATSGSDALRSPWNPYVALVGAGLLVVLAWSTGSRSAAGSFWLLPVGTVLVQGHLVTAPLVVATCVAAVVIAAVPDDASRDDRGRVPWRWVGAGLALTAVFWLPPVVQQLFGDDGNLAAILTRQGEGSTVGPGAALGSMSHMFSWVPSVFRPPEVISTFVPTALVVPLWLLVPVVAVVVALRRRDVVHLRGLVVAGAALVGCLVGIAATSGGLFDYLVVSSRPVVAVTLALGIGALARAAGERTRARLLVGLAVVAAGASISIGVQQSRGQNPIAGYGPTVDALAGSVDRAALTGTLSVDSVLDYRAAEVAPAVLLQLERRGHDVTSDGLSAQRIGAHRAARSADRLLIVAPLDQRDRLEAEGWRVLGEHQPMTPDELDRSEALRAERSELDRPVGADRESARFARIMEIAQELEVIEAGRVPMLIATRPA